MIDPDVNKMVEAAPYLTFLERMKLLDVLLTIDTNEKRESVLCSLAETISVVRTKRRYENHQVMEDVIRQLEFGVDELKKTLKGE